MSTMTHTSSATRRSIVKTTLLSLLVALVVSLGMPVFGGNLGILGPAPASASVGGRASVSPAILDLSDAYPFKFRNGLFSKNWRCQDPPNGWYGQPRWTREGAYIDCESYNSRA